MSSDFLTCKRCDFEWHRKDGSSCPICTKDSEKLNGLEFEGGMFGTGKNPTRMNRYYQALGIIALVYLIYLVFGA